MTVELFLISLCLNVPQDACLKTAEAYYQYSGLNVRVEDFGKKHKEVAYVTGVASVMREEKVTFPIYRNVIFNYNHKEKLTELIYQYGF